MRVGTPRTQPAMPADAAGGQALPSCDGEMPVSPVLTELVGLMGPSSGWPVLNSYWVFHDRWLHLYQGPGAGQELFFERYDSPLRSQKAWPCPRTLRVCTLSHPLRLPTKSTRFPGTMPLARGVRWGVTPKMLTQGLGPAAAPAPALRSARGWQLSTSFGIG